jgi:hypothetical protein
MSKIEVNTVEPQCGTTLTVGKCNTSVNVPGSATVTGNATAANLIASGNVVKTNALQASDAGNIISQSGTTITLGASGDTVSLASGASQTGFGRSGSVNWDTTAKTAGFTGVSGNGYFINTTSGSITVNLPASPSAGDIMSVADYTGTAETNNIIIGRNSSNINGAANDFTIFQNDGSITCVYVDGTEGWRIVSATTPAVVGSDFVQASVSGSGNTLSTAPDCGNFKIATFTGPGNFTVTNAGNPSGSTAVAYLVLAGGGGGGCGGGGPSGGGGAGGHRVNFGTPIADVPVSVQAYPIVVGAGGAGSPGYTTAGSSGGTSSGIGISSAGGGGGGSHPHPSGPNGVGVAGGSGGGGGGSSGGANAGGAGNTPPVSPPQGNPGGATAPSPDTGGTGGGGGGGANSAGTNGTRDGSAQGGPGGNGVANSITGSSVTRGGGGGGGRNSQNPGVGEGGAGGSGGGGKGQTRCGPNGSAGTAQLGGGGGGRAGGPGSAGYNGGSGIVIIRYRFQ